MQLCELHNANISSAKSVLEVLIGCMRLQMAAVALLLFNELQP